MRMKYVGYLLALVIAAPVAAKAEPCQPCVGDSVRVQDGGALVAGRMVSQDATSLILRQGMGNTVQVSLLGQVEQYKKHGPWMVVSAVGLGAIAATLYHVASPTQDVSNGCATLSDGSRVCGAQPTSTQRTRSLGSTALIGGGVGLVGGIIGLKLMPGRWEIVHR